jgi:hypothetical protein
MIILKTHDANLLHKAVFKNKNRQYSLTLGILGTLAHFRHFPLVAKPPDGFGILAPVFLDFDEQF